MAEPARHFADLAKPLFFSANPRELSGEGFSWQPSTWTSPLRERRVGYFAGTFLSNHRMVFRLY